MATFTDDNGTDRLTGTLEGEFDATGVLGESHTGDNENGDDVTIKAGDGNPGNGDGGDVIVQAGDGDSRGSVTILGGDGSEFAVFGPSAVSIQQDTISATPSTLGFYGTSAIAKPTISNATAADIITALAALGLVTDDT